MDADWNPRLYLRFEAQRTRPARDLLARVALDAPAQVIDLGCGPGNSTELLIERFPQARVVGIDHSEAMLTSARARLPGCRFELGDIASWQPETAPDLIYANAALQWVGAHETLVPRLFAQLAPGGVLAIQTPDNLDEPSHRLMREVASQAPYATLCDDAAGVRTRLLPLETYYDLLAPRAAEVEVWCTVYQHPMATAASIVDWLRSTGLKPYLDPLPEALRTTFLADYERRIALACPPRADGRRLLAFPRRFIVAQRAR
ncbi:MAG: trans-aconitate 2-methyltransferase [Burkholderiaceae bacterium]